MDTNLMYVAAKRPWGGSGLGSHGEQNQGEIDRDLPREKMTPAGRPAGSPLRARPPTELRGGRDGRGLRGRCLGGSEAPARIGVRGLQIWGDGREGGGTTLPTGAVRFAGLDVCFVFLRAKSTAPVDLFSAGTVFAVSDENSDGNFEFGHSLSISYAG